MEIILWVMLKLDFFFFGGGGGAWGMPGMPDMFEG